MHGTRPGVGNGSARVCERMPGLGQKGYPGALEAPAKGNEGKPDDCPGRVLQGMGEARTG